MEFEVFVEKWEHFTRQFMTRPEDRSLFIASASNAKYRYVSQHECKSEGFRFAFMKERNSEHFPEQTAKVVQLGGYIPIQVERTHQELNTQVKVLAFITKPGCDLAFYRRQSYQYLNIYEPFYENCVYEYIMEFFVEEQEVDTLMSLLKLEGGNEVAVYKECPVLHA